MPANHRVEAEHAILDFLWRWVDPDVGPTFREMAAGTEIPLGTTHAICEDLRDRGLIRYRNNIPRTLALEDAGIALFDSDPSN